MNSPRALNFLLPKNRQIQSVPSINKFPFFFLDITMNVKLTSLMSSTKDERGAMDCPESPDRTRRTVQPPKFESSVHILIRGTI